MTEEKELTPTEVASEWENYVRTEVNTVLDDFLPEAVSGNVGIKYIRPILKMDPSSGKPIEDVNKAKGVMVVVELNFAQPIEFFDEVPPGGELIE